MKQELDTRRIAKDLRLRHWATIMRERKDSGQSIRAWCREQGICEKTWYYWQRKLRESVCETLVQHQETTVVPTAAFAEVKMTAPPARDCAIRVRLGDVEIEIAGDASPSAIEAVLRALSSR